MNIINNILNLINDQKYDNPLYTPRDLVDHIAVGAIVKNNKNQILLQDHVKYNFWTIPIGKAEANQTPKEAIIQELFEELGITVIDLKLINTVKKSYSRGGNIFVNVNEYLFEILEYNGIPKNLEVHKHRSIKWMSMNQIKKLSSVSNFTSTMLQVYK